MVHKFVLSVKLTVINALKHNVQNVLFNISKTLHKLQIVYCVEQIAYIAMKHNAHNVMQLSLL